MKVKEMPVPKRPIQLLDGDDLEALVKFSKGKEFEILKDLAQKEKYQRYQSDFLTAKSLEDINFIRGVNVGIDFILDSVNRAQEELKSRGAEVDNEDDLK
jgi:hypothetical protein